MGRTEDHRAAFVGCSAKGCERPSTRAISRHGAAPIVGLARAANPGDQQSAVAVAVDDRPAGGAARSNHARTRESSAPSDAIARSTTCDLIQTPARDASAMGFGVPVIHAIPAAAPVLESDCFVISPNRRREPSQTEARFPVRTRSTVPRAYALCGGFERAPLSSLGSFLQGAATINVR